MPSYKDLVLTHSLSHTYAPGHWHSRSSKSNGNLPIFVPKNPLPRACTLMLSGSMTRPFETFRGFAVYLIMYPTMYTSHSRNDSCRRDYIA